LVNVSERWWLAVLGGGEGLRRGLLVRWAVGLTEPYMNICEREWGEWEVGAGEGLRGRLLGLER